VSKTDRELLAELVHRYADAVVHRDGEQWAATWAEDATWVLGPGREVVGRTAIVELWQGAMGRFDAVVQNVVNGEVTVDGDTASGRWYIMEHFRKSSGEPGILLAFYDDTYVRAGIGWLFASRRLSAQYQGPPDLSAPFFNSIAQ
jgi:ketosteroid isomerase-like protein